MTYFVITSPIRSDAKISRKHECILVRFYHMVAEWKHFMFMQIDSPRWRPGAVTKKSTNTKMTISQEPLDEIVPSLFQNVSCMKLC